MKLKLVNLVPLKEGGAFGMSAKDLAATYSLKMLQQMRDETMMDMENDPSVEPEGGSQADYYGGTLNGLDDAIAIKRGDSGTPLTYDQAVGRVSRDQFIKSKKFDRGGNRIDEATEKSWNAVDVSRKAEKEISNKEWNERTSKKLDMLKKLNDAGKFKKDFDDERLQGWVDQNYSWEKLSKQFKLNEGIYKPSSMPTVFDDESMDELLDIILKYVKDPDDAYAELDRFDDGGFDNMSDMVTSNLLRDPEYKAWYNKLHSVQEPEDLRLEPEEEDSYRDMVQGKYSDDDLKLEPEMDEDYKPSLRAYDVIDKSNNDEIVAKKLSYDRALEKAHTNPNYKIKATQRLAQEGSCGYGPDGVPGDTPGETKGMPADDRTKGMLRKLIQREIAKHENK